MKVLFITAWTVFRKTKREQFCSQTYKRGQYHSLTERGNLKELFAKSRVELGLLVEGCIRLQSNRKELEESIPRLHSYPCPCISCQKHVWAAVPEARGQRSPLMEMAQSYSMIQSREKNRE